MSAKKLRAKWDVWLNYDEHEDVVRVWLSNREQSAVYVRDLNTGLVQAVRRAISSIGARMQRKSKPRIIKA